MTSGFTAPAVVVLKPPAMAVVPLHLSFLASQSACVPGREKRGAEPVGMACGQGLEGTNLGGEGLDPGLGVLFGKMRRSQGDGDMISKARGQE